jgi:hypothetical protein
MQEKRNRSRAEAAASGPVVSRARVNDSREDKQENPKYEMQEKPMGGTREEDELENPMCGAGEVAVEQLTCMSSAREDAQEEIAAAGDVHEKPMCGAHKAAQESLLCSALECEQGNPSCPAREDEQEKEKVSVAWDVQAIEAQVRSRMGSRLSRSPLGLLRSAHGVERVLVLGQGEVGDTAMRDWMRQEGAGVVPKPR